MWWLLLAYTATSGSCCGFSGPSETLDGCKSDWEIHKKYFPKDAAGDVIEARCVYGHNEKIVIIFPDQK